MIIINDYGDYVVLWQIEMLIVIARLFFLMCINYHIKSHQIISYHRYQTSLAKVLAQILVLAQVLVS